MSISIEEKGTILFELSYLLSEYGGGITDEESDLLEEVLRVAQLEGIEYIGDEVWEKLVKIYKKYENREIDDTDSENGGEA